MRVVRPVVVMGVVVAMVVVVVGGKAIVDVIGGCGDGDGWLVHSDGDKDDNG